MKIHLNSIKREEGIYTYVYHAQEKEKTGRTFPYFAVAGIIGSFKVVSERSWLYLIPFWIIIFTLSKGVDWLMRKWGSKDKIAQVRFQSKYPHYNMGDILWMLKYTNQESNLYEIVRNASNNWGTELDIEIGTLSAIETGNANFSKAILNDAVKQQSELQQEWSLLNGQKYPDLRMPKR